MPYPPVTSPYRLSGLDLRGSFIRVYVDDSGAAVAVDEKNNRIAGPSKDHGSVIQDAIDRGGIVFIDRGEYVIGAPISPHSGVTILAHKARLVSDTVLFYTNDDVKSFELIGGEIIVQNDRWIWIRGKADRIVLRGVKFTGVCDCEGVRFDNAEHVVLDRLYVEPRANAIMVLKSTEFVVKNSIILGDRYYGAGFISNGVYIGDKDSTNVRIINNFISGHSHNGIFAAGGKRILIANNYIHNCGDGIDINYVEDVAIIGNILHDNSSGGDAYVGVESASKRITIAGNVFVQETMNGKFIVVWGTSDDYAEHVTIIGNTFVSKINLAKYIMWVSKGRRVVFANNTVFNDIYGGTMYGIRITNGSEDIVVQGNIIWWKGDGGSDPASSNVNTIRVEDADKVYIRGNIIRGAWSRQPAFIRVYSEAGEVVVEDNVFDDLKSVDGVPVIIADKAIVARRNMGYITENSGVATIAAGSTKVTVSHGLSSAPSKVLITPLGQPPGKIWVENITDTSFDIVTDTAPSSDLKIAWHAET